MHNKGGPEAMNHKAYAMDMRNIVNADIDTYKPITDLQTRTWVHSILPSMRSYIVGRLDNKALIGEFSEEARLAMAEWVYDTTMGEHYEQESAARSPGFGFVENEAADDKSDFSPPKKPSPNSTSKADSDASERSILAARATRSTPIGKLSCLDIVLLTEGSLTTETDSREIHVDPSTIISTFTGLVRSANNKQILNSTLKRLTAEGECNIGKCRDTDGEINPALATLDVTWQILLKLSIKDVRDLLQALQKMGGFDCEVTGWCVFPEGEEAEVHLAASDYINECTG